MHMYMQQFGSVDGRPDVVTFDRMSCRKGGLIPFMQSFIHRWLAKTCGLCSQAEYAAATMTVNSMLVVATAMLAAGSLQLAAAGVRPAGSNGKVDAKLEQVTGAFPLACKGGVDGEANGAPSLDLFFGNDTVRFFWHRSVLSFCVPQGASPTDCLWSVPAPAWISKTAQKTRVFVYTIKINSLTGRAKLLAACCDEGARKHARAGEKVQLTLCCLMWSTMP